MLTADSHCLQQKRLSGSHTQQKVTRRCKAILLQIEINFKKKKKTVGSKCLYTQFNRL